MSPSVLTQINVQQPGDIPPRVFDFWDNLILPEQLSASATRIDHPDTGDWKFSWTVAGTPSTADVLGYISIAANIAEDVDLLPTAASDITITILPDINWLVASYQGFPPQQIARFFLRGSHDVHVPVPDNLIAITIDAATAFGSGEHGTTRGCLLALDQLADNGATPTRILDLGTGSGILAIAAKKSWPHAMVTAVDNDPESVHVAARYATLNDSPMNCLLADTPLSSNVLSHGPYDMIVANILAAPLRALAPDITKAAAQTCILILSGLLDRQIDEVLSAYTPQGWILQTTLMVEDWATLILRKNI